MPENSTSRRSFLAHSSLGLLGTALAPTVGDAQATPPAAPQAAPIVRAAPSMQVATPGAPPAFGTAASTGPQVTTATFVEAEKLVQFELTPADREQAAGNWRNSMAAVYERRVGPRKVAIEDAIVPWSHWSAALPGTMPGPEHDRFIPSMTSRPPLPRSDAEVAFAPVTHLSHWIMSRQITSMQLTTIYLDRIARFDVRLRCVITVTRERALAEARQADLEIAAGRFRGPLHGIPYGVKDLLDTANIATTYGAEPFRSRIPTTDSAVVRRLNAAGAVLIAKLSLGALALNDIWFGGQTMNPWLLEEGSSGSSAGPGSATAAGLVGFSIGSETEGSIVSPTMRCGLNGLRPTFGRVSRTGAMALSWSLDKLGPMARSVEDTLIILNTISGIEAGDLANIPTKLDYDAGEPVAGLRVGYFPKWMQEAPATDVDRGALATVRKLGMMPVEVTLPDWPYGSLNVILFAEAAAAFEELTLSHAVDQLKAQVPDAWPNTFRQARFLSAVDFVQADRFRRKVALEMARIFTQVDVLLVPSLRDEMLTISNFTGHPSLTLRAGFVEVTEARSDWAPDPAHPLPKFSPARRVPHGITLIGRLFDEGTLGRVGLALEQAFDVQHEHPEGFA